MKLVLITVQYFLDCERCSASWLVGLTADQVGQVQALARMLCPLSTQVYRWVLANLMLGVTLLWTRTPSWSFHALETVDKHRKD